jgi:hypothetical protein
MEKRLQPARFFVGVRGLTIAESGALRGAGMTIDHEPTTGAMNGGGRGKLDKTVVDRRLWVAVHAVDEGAARAAVKAALGRENVRDEDLFVIPANSKHDHRRAR